MAGLLGGTTPQGTQQQTPANWYGNTPNTSGGWLPRYPGNNPFDPMAFLAAAQAPANVSHPAPQTPSTPGPEPSGGGDMGGSSPSSSESGASGTPGVGPTAGQQMGALFSDFTAPNALAQGLSSLTGLSPRASQAGIGLAGVAPMVGLPISIANALASIYNGFANPSAQQSLQMGFNPSNFTGLNTDTEFGDFGHAFDNGAMFGLNGTDASAPSGPNAGATDSGPTGTGNLGSPSSNASFSLSTARGDQGPPPGPPPDSTGQPTGAPPGTPAGPTGEDGGVGNTGSEGGPGPGGGGGGAGGGGACSLMSFAVQRLQPQDAAQTQQFMQDFYQKFVQQDPKEAKRLFAGYQRVARGIIKAAVKTGQEDAVAQYIYDKLIAPFGNTLDDAEVPAAVQHMAMVVRGLREHFGLQAPPTPKFQGQPLGVDGQQFKR